MNGLISAIKAFVLKNRPAYRDYLGNGKYDIKKLPEECVPDSVNNKIRIAQRTANDAQSTANDARRNASNALSTASNALSTATDTATRINNATTFVTEFASLQATKNKERHNFAENISLNGTSALPLAEARAPMKCYFDIMLNDSSNHNIKHYAAFEGKIVREVTKRSDTYCLFIDESVEVVNGCFAKLKIGYKFSNDDNLWHKFIRAEVTLPDADYNNTSITTIILNARGIIPNTYNYAPWPSICVPLAGTNDAGVVYASDKTDDQTVPVSIDKNGYLWCKGSETLPTDGNPGDILVKTETGSAWQKQEPATSTPDWDQNDSTASDYIKNRPFYTGETVQTEVIPEQTYTLTSAGSLTMYEDQSGTYPYSLEDGKNYIVVYNGTTYELTSSNSEGISYVGDMGPLEGVEATVPFVIAAGNGALHIYDYNGNTEVTFKIVFSESVINKIDTKYIPWSDAVGLKPPVFIRKSLSYFTDDEKQKYYDSFLSGSLIIYDVSDTHGIVVSMLYSKVSGFNVIVLNHIGMLNIYSGGKWEYSDITKSGIGTAIRDELKNTKSWGLFGVPVSSVSNGDIFRASIAWNSKTNKPCINKDIKGSSYIEIKISDIFCSEDKEIVLSSSTTNSTKKFKITVDDTGTISATEVT